MRKLGVGVIGAGFSGKMHARSALANGARLVGIVGTDEEKSRRAAEQLGAEERFADARSLIEHRAVDVVHVCTPNVFHVPLADYALAQGKHVVCEKPLAVGVKDATALAGRAAEAGVIAAVPFLYRYHAGRIVHAQAKDVELDAAARNRFGLFGKALGRSDPWDNGWYRYRVPGRGIIDWPRVVDALYETGFAGVLSVEHEDPVWSGEQGRVLDGLRIARATLRPLVIQETAGP